MRGTEAIQYSNTGTAAPVIFIGYTHLAVLGAEEIENKLHLLFTVGPRDERAAGPECKKAKVQQQKQKLTCDISAAMRADGAPSPPRDGDTTGGTTGGGGGGCIPMQLHRTA